MTLPHEEIETLEFERKFLVPPTRANAAFSCLQAYCRPDSRYPVGEVHSIYFDTPSLRLLQEKVDSDLYKTKVRLRWYEDPERGPSESVSFLEVKHRIGARRSKWRRTMPLGAVQLSNISLTDPALAEGLDDIEIDPTVTLAGLQPVMIIKYLRHRWEDPLTGARICLDQRISAPRVNPRLLTRSSDSELPATVLEIKNRTGTAPVNLHFLTALKAELSSFSKYSACFEAITRNKLTVA